MEGERIVVVEGVIEYEVEPCGHGREHWEITFARPIAGCGLPKFTVPPRVKCTKCDRVLKVTPILPGKVLSRVYPLPVGGVEEAGRLLMKSPFRYGRMSSE